MRLATRGRRAYTYKETVPDNLAVSLALAKSHLKKTLGDEDTLITFYLKAAISFAEQFTRRDFITRTYTTFRDFFPGTSEGYYPFGELPSLGTLSTGGGNLGFEIRRSPLQSVTSVKYFKATVLTTVDASVFYNTVEEDYSEILTNDDKCWPEDADRRLQTIQIEFKTGFGDTDESTPDWAVQGILQHVANLYRNRGDCSEADVKTALPAAARSIYLQNRIENL